MVGGEWKYIQWNKYRRNIKKKKRIRRDECNEVGKNEAAQKKKKILGLKLVALEM